jgi:preprotein translocase subunit SecA
VEQRAENRPNAEGSVQESSADVHHASAGSAQSQSASRRSAPYVGRNDPCPCGSGKKYKKCHGAARSQ